MDAKKWMSNNGFYPGTLLRSTSKTNTPIPIDEVLESYHQAKSKEEAEERYDRAKNSMDKVLDSSPSRGELKGLIYGHLITASGHES